ncbi:MAG: hypothetical protein ACR2QO_27050 [Acidimicrobiales bacterium]
MLKAAEWLANCYLSAEALDLIAGALAGWARDLPAGRRASLLAGMAPTTFHIGRVAASTINTAGPRHQMGSGSSLV